MSTNTTSTVDITLDTNDITLSQTEDLVTSNAHCIDLEKVDSTVEGYKKEYSIVGDGLYASVSAEDTPQWLAAIIDDVVANSVANGMTDYNLLVQDVRNAIDALDVATNTYVEQINFDATVNQIIGSRLETLNSTLENTYATIVDLDTAVVNNDFALTQRANELEATFNAEISSNVANVTQAYSNADSALADDITALTTVFEDQESNLAAASTAITGLQTYVGVTESNIPDGTGILSSIALLQKQADGLVETFVGAHELINNDMDGDINTNELRVDQWPYALWVPMEGTVDPTFTTRVAYKDAVAEQYPVPEHTVYKNTSNNTFWEYHPISYGGWEEISEADYNNRLTIVRDAHVGDTYVRYEVVNGVREYVESYKFIKDGIDNTIPYNTDRDGYSWAVVSNTPAEAAYLEALNAYALADGKISQFYAWGGPNAPADYTITNPDGSTETISGSAFRYWFLNGVLKYYNGTSWVNVPTNIGSSVHLEDGDLLVVFDPETRDYTYYMFNGTSWQINGPDGVISKSKFFVDLENEVTGANGHVASSLAQLEIDSQAYADDAATNVQNKFAYDSRITLNNVVYESGFGLNALGTTGSGTEADPYNSEFWINAEKFKFTNSNATGSVAPFTIDASGTQPYIVFNGLVSFGSGQSGTVEEAIASTIETIVVGDKSVSITDNLIPTESLVGDTNNAGYQFVGNPVKSIVAGIDTFAEAQIALDYNDEVYSPYVDETFVPYYYRFGFKGISLNSFKIIEIDSSNNVNSTTITVSLEEAMVDTEWYIIDGLINPYGGDSLGNNGTIRKADGTKIGTVQNKVLLNNTNRLLLGWEFNCTISRMKIAKITADTLIGSYTTYDYVDNAIDSIDVSSQLPQTINSTNAPTSSNVYPVGSIWRQEITIEGTTQYLHFLSQGSGIWRNVGGTYINGSDIITGTIDATRIDTDNLTAKHVDVSSSSTGGRLELKDNVIKVYDQSNVLRVQLGDLSA
jgi:hypothetical protein